MLIENIITALAILIVFFELYRLLRAIWVRRKLEQKKKAKRPLKPMNSCTC